MSLDLSIVVADAEDLRIKDCVASIDEDVEVVVSLNGATQQLRKMIDTLSVKACLSEERGLAMALNRGIDCARHEKIVVVDSDCYFEKGTVRKLWNSLSSNEMVRGTVIYTHEGILTELVAKARNYHANPQPSPGETIRAYKPLGFHKQIRGRLGGYFYDEDLKLSEDYEMDYRRQAAKIPLIYIPDAIIRHTPISPFKDLRSAFRYGLDRHTSVSKGLVKPKKHFTQSLRKLRERGLSRLGTPGLMYMILWTVAYDLGYHAQKFFDVNGVKK